jgi:SAM-dependent methyltransferase
MIKKLQNDELDTSTEIFAVFQKSYAVEAELLEIAKDLESEREFHCMDMMKTHYKDGHLNGIISFHSIIHTPKKETPRFFQEFNRILKPNGKLLLVTKKGVSEGIINDEWYEGNEVYFTNYQETDLEGYFISNGFEIEFQETRRPYHSEIEVERIHIIGRKL